VGSGVDTGGREDVATAVRTVVGADVGVLLPELLRQPAAASIASAAVSVSMSGDRGVIV